MKKFNIGDVVYSASYGQIAKQVTCPVCFGKLKVTVILGNDERVEVDCDYCGKGYEDSKGYVTEYDYVAKAKCFVVNKIDVKVGRDKETRTYYSLEPEGYHYSYKEETCFATKEEALKEHPRQSRISRKKSKGLRLDI